MFDPPLISTSPNCSVAQSSLHFIRRRAADVLRRSAIIAILLVTASAVGHPAAAQTGNIAGRVTDACTSAPIPNAQVTISGDTGVLPTLTNVDGEYFVANRPAGIYLVSVSLVGYGVEEADVEVVSGSTVGHNFQLIATGMACFSVTNLNDSGANSLRGAIAAANVEEGPNTITFDIAGPGPHVITLASPLPAITDVVTIDGTSQPGANCGSTLPDRDLQIVVSGGGSLTGDGLVLRPGSEGSIIRGLVINGFNGHGVKIDHSDEILLQCNIIGTDAAGSASGLGNHHGVGVVGGARNTIGGVGPGDGNLISGNAFEGVRLDAGADDNVVQGNFIGTDLSGIAALGNGGAGIAVSRGANNHIGGIAFGEANVIAYNGGVGVAVVEGSAIAILSNEIHSNFGIGIDLGHMTPADNVTTNDAGDADAGANGLQNFPTIESVLFEDGSVTVSGSLESTPSSSFELQFFASASCDLAGHGEGEKLIGSAAVATDGSGLAVFSGTFEASGIAVVTATATDESNDTSEFSLCAGPDIVAQEGHVFEYLATGLSHPQGMAIEASGNLIVAESGSGRVLSIDTAGAISVVAFNFSQPVDVAFGLDGTLYVSDLAENAIYQIEPSMLGAPGGVDKTTLSPLLSGLDGPTHLEVGPDGSVYATLVRTENDDRVVRIDGGSPVSTHDIITFSGLGEINPAGLAFDDGELYVAYSIPGEVRRLPGSTPLPAAGTSLSIAATGLTSPGGIDFGIQGELYIATSHEVAIRQPDASSWTPFVSGLSGDLGNSLVYSPAGVLYIADRAAGRIIQVTAPKHQVQPAEVLAFRINEAGSPQITDGSDISAITNAIQTWADVSTSSASFSYEGTTSATNASASDGINLVTYADDEFLFAPAVLAVAAKTIEFGDSPEVAHIVDADVVFNPFYVNHPVPTLRLGTETVGGAYDIQSVATHEFGHVLGLVHSGVPDATMFFVLQEAAEARSLTLDDRAWVSYHYPDASFTTLGSIGGQVEDGDSPGAPVAGALVIAENASTGDLVHAYTDLLGRYQIPGLPGGDYKIFVQPLDGNVAGYPITPGHVSAYLKTITTKTDYPNEYFNAGNESSNPITDIVTEFDLVTIGGGVSGIDFVTNLDLTPPAITGVSPSDGSAGVPVETDVLISFSEAVDPASLAGAFSLTSASGAVGGTILFVDESTTLFTPTSTLDFLTDYTLTIAASVADNKGNLMASPLTVTFQTEAPDADAPIVVETSPTDASVDVFITSELTMVFSEVMDASTLTTSSLLDPTPGSVRLTSGSTEVFGSLMLSLGNTVATFEPETSLAEGTMYTLSLSPSITDLSGNAIVPYSVTFTTVSTAAPLVVNEGPAPGATGITIATPILVDFSEPIDSATIDTGFRLTNGSSSVPGTFEFLNLNSRVIFRPNSSLEFGTEYVVRLTDAIADVSSPAMSLAETSWTFTTASVVTTPEITSVSPPSAAVGQIVSINGAGFDPVPANNLVSFNGTLALVSAATLNNLTTTVPAGASSGALTVTVGGSTSSAFTFGVVVPSEAVNAVIAKAATEGSPSRVDIVPDGTLAYVTNSASNSVSIIDLVGLSTITPSIPVGEHPFDIVINPQGTFAYVTNFFSHTVSVIDLLTDTVVETIPVGLNPTGVAVTPSGDRVYVAELTSQGLSVIDADPASGAFNHVVARVSTEGSTDVAIRPDGTIAFVTGPEGVVIVNVDPGSPGYNDVIAKTSTEGSKGVSISPDGAFAFVTSDDGGILIFDAVPSSPTAYQLIAKASTEGTRETTISPDGTLVYATNFDAGTVTVYAIEIGSDAAPSGATASQADGESPITGTSVTLREVDLIEVGSNPIGIVIDPTTKIAVVVNSGSDDVTIIRTTGASAEDLLLSLAEQLDALDVVPGVRNYGHVTALRASLEGARSHLIQGREKQAIQSLQMFIKKVNGFVKTGSISPAVGADLIASAQAVIDLIQASGKGGIADEGFAAVEELPAEFAVGQNYPNPFNPTTTITYDIPAGVDGAVHVLLEVYNVMGQRVAVIVNEEKSPGTHTAVWNGRAAGGAESASGIYLLRVQMGDFRQVRKMTLVR